jgi:DNA-binding transcriptional MerR regulator
MILRGIAEVADELDLPQHVLRFWEKEFGHLRPMRSGRRRYYRPEDVDTLRGIRVLLHDRGLTLDGLRRVFQERSLTFVRAVGRSQVAGDPIDALAAGLALAHLSPERRDALIETLADPTACRALVDMAVAHVSHRGVS